MAEYIKNNLKLQLLAVFIGLPLAIWTVGSFPQRTVLKESLSVITILAFSLMIGLLYLTRENRSAVQKASFRKVIALHKVVGYAAVPVLLLHPLFLVLPRFFEAGVAPGEALYTIITTVTSPGVILGLTAWSLLLTLGITSLLRKNLPLSYQTWRAVHYVLALLGMLSAIFHVINLGRHTDLIMTGFIVILSAGGIYQTTKKTFSRETQGEKR